MDFRCILANMYKLAEKENSKYLDHGHIKLNLWNKKSQIAYLVVHVLYYRVLVYIWHSIFKIYFISSSDFSLKNKNEGDKL